MQKLLAADLERIAVAVEAQGLDSGSFGRCLQTKKRLMMEAL